MGATTLNTNLIRAAFKFFPEWKATSFQIIEVTNLSKKIVLDTVSYLGRTGELIDTTPKQHKNKVYKYVPKCPTTAPSQIIVKLGVSHDDPPFHVSIIPEKFKADLLTKFFHPFPTPFPINNKHVTVLHRFM